MQLPIYCQHYYSSQKNYTKQCDVTELVRNNSPVVDEIILAPAPPSELISAAAVVVVAALPLVSRCGDRVLYAISL